MNWVIVGMLLIMSFGIFLALDWCRVLSKRLLMLQKKIYKNTPFSE